MSTDNHVQHAENAITPAPEGDGTISKRQNSLSVPDAKYPTPIEKETEAGEDDRDVKRKQASLHS